MTDEPDVPLHVFLNMVRSLYNIDSDCIPELTFDILGCRYHEDYWPEFRNDPPKFFINTDKRQQTAIMREILKRQPS